MARRIPWKDLFAAATEARARAYAPYSDFQVGAALFTSDGVIIPGGNVENASYGLSICAERNAFSRAVLDGHRRVVAVAIVVDTETPTPPCGMCRQTMAEFAAPTLEVRCQNLQGRELRTTLKKLLPHAFTRAFL
jgi:cytidine deaminase